MPELFGNFEVNRESRWPILLQLVGASLLFHITAVACVMYVPGIRDTLNIAALLSHTGYGDRPYAKTAVGEDIQMVMLSGEKFHYPEGYFAFVSGSVVPQSPQVVDPFAPKIISSAKPEREKAIPSPSPSPEIEASPALPKASPTVTTADTVAENEKTESKNAEQAEQELNKIAAENSVVRPSENEINTRPLKDWLARANELKTKGELDLTGKVEITIAARLTSECRLSDANIVSKSGDARLVDVARDMVSAISDSRMLSFLRDPKKVKDPKELKCDEVPLHLTIKLDQNEVNARVESQAESPERAAEMAKGYSGLLTVGQLVKSGHDEEVLYRNTRVVSEGKQIVVSFSMPRDTASEMLKKQLPAS
jgi:hypothetical protein